MGARHQTPEGYIQPLLTVLAFVEGWQVLGGLQRQFLQLVGHRLTLWTGNQQPQHPCITLYIQQPLRLHLSCGKVSGVYQQELSLGPSVLPTYYLEIKENLFRFSADP